MKLSQKFKSIIIGTILLNFINCNATPKKNISNQEFKNFINNKNLKPGDSFKLHNKKVIFLKHNISDASISYKNLETEIPQTEKLQNLKFNENFDITNINLSQPKTSYKKKTDINKEILNQKAEFDYINLRIITSNNYKYFNEKPNTLTEKNILLAKYLVLKNYKSNFLLFKHYPKKDMFCALFYLYCYILYIPFSRYIKKGESRINKILSHLVSCSKYTTNQHNSKLYHVGNLENNINSSTNILRSKYILSTTENFSYAYNLYREFNKQANVYSINNLNLNMKGLKVSDLNIPAEFSFNEAEVILPINTYDIEKIAISKYEKLKLKNITSEQELILSSLCNNEIFKTDKLIKKYVFKTITKVKENLYMSQTTLPMYKIYKKDNTQETINRRVYFYFHKLNEELASNLSDLIGLSDNEGILGLISTIKEVCLKNNHIWFAFITLSKIRNNIKEKFYDKKGSPIQWDTNKDILMSVTSSLSKKKTHFYSNMGIFKSRFYAEGKLQQKNSDYILQFRSLSTKIHAFTSQALNYIYPELKINYMITKPTSIMTNILSKKLINQRYKWKYDAEERRFKEDNPYLNKGWNTHLSKYSPFDSQKRTLILLDGTETSFKNVDELYYYQNRYLHYFHYNTVITSCPMLSCIYFFDKINFNS